MTNGGFGADPFGGAPFGHNPFGALPPVITAPTPQQPPAAPKTNTLATLSVVFAFVFAPAGAVLGHLGLREIHRTGEAGRSRAIVGISLSYTVIVIAVAALVIAAVLPDPATPTPATLAGKSDLPGLVVPFDRVKLAMGDVTLSEMAPIYVTRGSEGTWDPNECAPSIYAGTVWVYQHLGYRAIYQQEVGQPGAVRPVTIIQAVSVFDDAAAAGHAHADYISQLRGCVSHTLSDTGALRTSRWSIGPVEGISDGMVGQNSKSDLEVFASRVVTVRSNVLVDVSVSGPVVGDQAKQLARGILDNIGNLGHR